MPDGDAKLRLLDKVVAHFAAHGIGDTSLRSLAASISTSHRMLIYHFGSRQGLLTAVVGHVEHAQRAALDSVVADGDDVGDIGRRYWTQVTEAALIYGPLFFELSGQAMQGQPHAHQLREHLITDWLEPLVTLWQRAGYDDEDVRTRARLGLAVARGLLFDLLITQDRSGVDAAMEAFVQAFT
jgi:AcrR family transcriptional regulator